jgi:Transposase DDE domain group 1
MLTECSAELFEFAPVERRTVVAGFDGGAIRLIDRFAACFVDGRKGELIEHLPATLVGQRVFGIALGYEDVNDHDELRHDPIMAVLRASCERDARTVRRWLANRRSTGSS